MIKQSVDKIKYPVLKHGSLLIVIYFQRGELPDRLTNNLISMIKMFSAKTEINVPFLSDTFSRYFNFEYQVRS